MLLNFGIWLSNELSTNWLASHCSSPATYLLQFCILLPVTPQGLIPFKKFCNGRAPLHLCKCFTYVPFNEGSHEDSQTCHLRMIRTQMHRVQLARHHSGWQGRSVFVANQWLINASFSTASNLASSSRWVSKQEVWDDKADGSGQAAPGKKRHFSNLYLVKNH